MKKILIPLVVMAVLLSACGSSSTDESEKPKTENQSPEVKDSIEQSGNSETSQNVDVSVPVKLSEDEFATKVFDFRKGGNWKYQGDKPCMIDFYADWCGPCKIIAPYMDEFAKKYAGQIYVYKVNTDFAQELSVYFGINAIPAVMFCPMKGEAKMVVGANPKTEYENLIKTLLLASK